MAEPADHPQAQDAAEWLEPDGLGAYASGAVDGVRTRRHHALLVTCRTPPTDRLVLVNGVECFVETAGGRFALTSQRYDPGVLDPDGASRIAGFTRDPWPTWTYALPDGTAIAHELFVEPHSGAAVLRWRRLAGPDGPCTLTVRPLLTGRDHGDLHRRNDAFRFDAEATGGNVTWRPYRSIPAATALTDGVYRHDPVWLGDVLYTVERERGLPATEDVASPGLFTFDLAGSPATMVLRAGDGRSTDAARHAGDLAKLEKKRRRRLGASVLARSAAAYAVARGPGRTIVAGFPWFTDWGRDTFIAMRGLLLAMGRLDDARAVLLGWAAAVDGGMLPNRFPDTGNAPEFNAVDASLWFVVAVHDALDAFAAAGEPLPATDELKLRDAAEAILDGYMRGTRFNIGMDRDGLIHAGEAGVQLTWMDAITDGRVWTPRRGKPVEVQALWINALRIAATRWSERWAEPERRARASFAERFPAPDGGLYDVVDVDGVAGSHDGRVRPNQIFAVGGLPFPSLEGAAARRVVDLVEAKLWTPLGLRTLSPDDPDYIPRYRGTLAQRDAAYHQGTAWPWLLGPFVDAWLSVRGRTGKARRTAAARFLQPVMDHLDRNGLGHVSEVVDGDAPHHAGGCPWQAWSLGETIRIRRMLHLDI